jgi:hypothetical protein
MPVKYPKGPPPVGWELPRRLRLRPGEGINIVPFNAEQTLDFTTALGGCSVMVLKIISQLGKWGFDTVKIDESIEVSPVFKTYYDMTMRQKAELETRIKAGIADVFKVIDSLRVRSEELRRYKEFMDYYSQIERGKALISRGRTKEGEELRRRGEQTLKHVFVDTVDIHTGKGVALRDPAMLARWPTIMSDFLKLKDEDTDPKQIARKYHVSEAEGVILATKNKLYIEWRDRLFKPKVTEEYERVLSLVETGKKSLEEYRRMLKPLIARHRAMRDMAEKPAALQRVAIWRPDAQAMSIDFVRLWAWVPFAPTEKYRILKETLDLIPAREAGFTVEEIAELRRELGPDWDGRVEALPIEPSIDRLVRRFIGPIARHYGVKITALDLYNARRILTDKFKASFMGFTPWVFSPYFVFHELPMTRLVISLPKGPEVEILTITRATGAAKSQNVILLHCLEIVARGKRLEGEIDRLVGEAAAKPGELIPIGELVRREYPEIYPKKPVIGARLSAELWRLRQGALRLRDALLEIKSAIGEALAWLGLDIPLLRVIGPYEYAFLDRITRFYLKRAAKDFDKLVKFIKSGFRVVGVEAVRPEWVE